MGVYVHIALKSTQSFFKEVSFYLLWLVACNTRPKKLAISKAYLDYIKSFLVCLIVEAGDLSYLSALKMHSECSHVSADSL